MSSNHRADNALAHARQLAARLKPVARSTSAAATHGVRSARALAAPQVERAGHLVQEDIAPKISSLLSAAAQRIDPAKPHRRRWRKVAGASMVTAAASAVAGAVVSRRRQNASAPDAEAGRYRDVVAHNGEADS
jgi:hypothetical protein